MKYHCNKCGKDLEETNFYTYKNGDKVELCKKCLTMRVDPFDSETYLWLIEKMDVPYLPTEWNKLLEAAYAKNPNKVNGGAIFGRYLSKMKGLKQFKGTSWEDTERLQKELEGNAQAELENIKQYEAELKEQFEAGEISKAEYETMTSASSLHETLMNAPINPYVDPNNPYNENGFAFQEDINLDDSIDLTEDDKLYLAMKWGRLYKPSEWVQLEQLYNEFVDVFVVKDPARLDTLKKICKTSIKMDQAIDCGDIEGYQKLSRVYDTLMKSGKFTEAQKKEEKAGEFDCVGLIVNFAESREGGGKIPRHKIDTPLDIVDNTIVKLKDYYNSLIKNDPNIEQQIENYIKKRETLAEQKKDKAEAQAQGFNEYQITDEDLAAMREAEMQDRVADAEYIESLREE